MLDGEKAHLEKSGANGNEGDWEQHGGGGAAQKTLENIPCPTMPPLSISNEPAC